MELFEFEPQPTKEEAGNYNNEQIRQILSAFIIELQNIKKRIDTLENKG